MEYFNLWRCTFEKFIVRKKERNDIHKLKLLEKRGDVAQGWRKVHNKTNSIPQFIFLVSLVQILVWNLDAPCKKVLRFDGTKRNEIWRFITVALVHQKTAEDKYGHISNNIFAQLFFGWSLEGILSWKRTAVLYLSSVCISSLVSSAIHPVNYSVGASGATYGLKMATFAGHLMMKRRCKKLYWKLLWIILPLEIAAVFLISEHWYTYKNINVDHTGHLGGAIGGFLVGVLVWPTTQRRWSVIWKSICFTVLAVLVAVTVIRSINIYHFKEYMISTCEDVLMVHMDTPSSYFSGCICQSNVSALCLSVI